MTAAAPAPPPQPADVLGSRLSSRGRSLSARNVLFRVYLGLLVGPAVAVGAQQALVGAAWLLGLPLPLAGAAAAGQVAVVLAVVAFVVLAALVHTGAWRGPFLLERADAFWLLGSPLPRRLLVGRRLRRAAWTSAAAGAGAGAVAGMLAAFALDGAALPATVTGAAGGAGIALLGLAGAWWTVLHPHRAHQVVRATALAAGAAVALAVTAVAVPAVAPLLTWSGPWGWAAMATAQAAGASPAPAAALLALSAVTAATATAAVLRTAARAPAEGLTRATGPASGAATAAFMLDVDTVAEVRCDALAALRPPVRRTLPAPARPALAIAWRDVVSLLRAPGQTVAGLGALAAAGALTALAVTGPAAGAEPVQSGARLFVAAAVGQAAAKTLVAPLRSALAAPFGHLHLPWSHPVLVRRHLAVPLSLLVVAGALLAGVATAALGGPWWAAAGGAAAAGLVLALGAALQLLRPPPEPNALVEQALSGDYGLLAHGLSARALTPPLVLLAVAAPAAALTSGMLPAAVAATLGVGWAGGAGALLWWRLARKAGPWATGDEAP